MSDKDDGTSTKRPKTNDDAGEHRLREIIDQLTARNEELTIRNAELESEIRDLRGEENDESVLPVVVKKISTVDLSRVNPFLVARVASFLGLSRELLSMALACKAFGWRQPSSTPGLSLVEEAARRFLTDQLRPSEIERSALSRYGSDDTTTWLSDLQELERLRLPLKFSELVGSGIEYSERDVSVVKVDPGNHHLIAMTNYVTRRGVHYATFKLIKGMALVGVVRPLRDFDAANEVDGYDFMTGDNGNFLAQRTDKWIGDVHCCGVFSGGAVSSDWESFAFDSHSWEEGHDGHFVVGDTVGLLVDLNEGTLIAYKNGHRLGVAKEGLAGEYCFYARLSSRNVSVEVSIKRETPPGAVG